MESEKKIVIPARVMSRQIGDEAVILDLVSGTYFALDPVGARMWQLLVDGHHADSVVAMLIADYNVPESQLRQDVLAFVGELATRGLVEVQS